MPSPCIYASFRKENLLMTLWGSVFRLLQYLLPPLFSGISVLDALFLLKMVLTGLGAEIKSLVLESGAELGFFFIDFHAAYRVFCHGSLLF